MVSPFSNSLKNRIINVFCQRFTIFIIWNIEIFNRICKEVIQFFCNFLNNLLIVVSSFGEIYSFRKMTFFDKKGLTVFQKRLLSVMLSRNNLFYIFTEVKSTYFFVCKIASNFLHFCFVKKRFLNPPLAMIALEI